MFSDIATPKNNEDEFIEIASKLGIKKLYFLYNFDNYNEGNAQKKLNSINYRNIETETGFIVNQKNMNKALQYSKFLVVKSSDKDGYFIESKKIKLIYGFEELQRKDYLHQRWSGLNHVLCELANKNNIIIAFSYSSLFNKNPVISSQIIGRMMQNIALCRKYKVKTAIASFATSPFEMRAQHDVASLFSLLGMDGKIITESMSLSF